MPEILPLGRSLSDFALVVFGSAAEQKPLLSPPSSLSEPSGAALPPTQAWELCLAVPLELQRDVTHPLWVLLVKIPPQIWLKSLPQALSRGCCCSRLSHVFLFTLCVCQQSLGLHTQHVCI